MEIPENMLYTVYFSTSFPWKKQTAHFIFSHVHFQFLMQSAAMGQCFKRNCIANANKWEKKSFYTKLSSWHCLPSHCWKYGSLPRYCTQMGPVTVPVNYILMNWCEFSLVLVQYLAWVWGRKTSTRAPRTTQASPLGCPAVEMSILLSICERLFFL